MMYEGGEMDDDESIGGWLSRTGTSHMRVTWTMEKDDQKF
jgi:hypothetical protein